MRDIDGQEIQVGDVVQIISGVYNQLFGWRLHKIVEVRHDKGVVWVHDPRDLESYIQATSHEIFCLFYRKPTPQALPSVAESTPSSNAVYFDDGKSFLRKVVDGKTFAIDHNAQSKEDWFKDVADHTLEYLRDYRHDKQLTEQEAREQFPNAF